MKNLIITALDSLFWRIRGGLRIPFTDKKFPLNKIWFALLYSAEYCYLTVWDFNKWLVSSIATLVSYQAYGWGEFISCVTGGGKPSERSDCDLVDDIVDNLKITYKGKVYKLTDYPVLFGWVGLSLRGLILTFIIGLAFNNIPYMLTGLGMGTCYWLGGIIGRKILKKEDKTSWNIGEWIFGAYLGLVLILCVR
jgi:hypothetical protein